MTRSTTRVNPRGALARIWPVFFWLTIWQAASMLVGQDLLLTSPVGVVARISQLAQEAGFWRAILFSFSRIVAGFLLAVSAGILFAACSYRFEWVRRLLQPLISTMKATPVASFIILCLIWIPSKNLSVFISFVMVLPVLYTNLLEGLRNTDPRLLEMARLFRVPVGRKVRYIYLSQVMPFFRSACTVSLGMCWKSGIAAEVIGIPRGSIGESLYQAKIYLDTPDLFAWTVVIICASVLFERAFLFALNALMKKLERM